MAGKFGLASLSLARIWDLVSGFGAKDFFDILIIAAFLYFFIVLFLRMRSTPIFLGLAVLVLTYGFAILFNLPMTKTLFSYFFSVLLFVLIIIFQKELRRFFQMLGVLGIKTRLKSSYEGLVKSVSAAAETMAFAKTGALIVISGTEAVERYSEGGFLLNGVISEALLLSIFDKNSAGHDGAVIIENGRVRKFAAHLPLADNPDRTRRFGTRHRAALGITDRTDALCVVVSEEKGIISLARDGELRRMADAEELSRAITRFYEEKFPEKKLATWKKWGVKNFLPILLSACLSVVLWSFFNYQSLSVQKTFLAPIEFRGVSEEHLVEGLSESKILVILSGYQRDFKIFDDKSLSVVLDMGGMKTGNQTLLLKKEFVKKPDDLSVVSISPATLRFKLVEKPKEELVETPEEAVPSASPVTKPNATVKPR